MSQPRLLDSIFTRLVAWSIAVSILVVLILGALVLTKIGQMSENTMAWSIDADIAAVREAEATDGSAAIIEKLSDRLEVRTSADQPTRYFLGDENGTRVAGDILTLPQGLKPGDPVKRVELPGGDHALARAIRLDNGQILVVAREYGWSQLLKSQIALAFVLGGIFVVLAVGVAGLLTAKRLARRVGRINSAFREPDDRSLAMLDRGRHDRDEIGELARHSLGALDRQKRLVDAHRQTADHIAHEMRTPLMHLDNRLFRIAQHTGENETRGAITDARGEIRTIIAMLESLLDIATNEAQRGDSQGLAPVDLSRLALHIADLYAASAEETGHQLVQDIEPRVMIAGDEMQLTRLLTNLLDNAFKYVPAGGMVRLSVKKGPVVTVEDDGPGIPEEERSRIFDRFRRGGSHRSENNGAGLGLALARAIAARHGLELALADSARGARFVIRREEG